MIRKFFFISTIILTFSIALKSQSLPVDEDTGLITYQEVVEEQGSPQDFFNRAIEWINGYYSNPVDVTKTRDPQTGLIKGLHRIKLKNTLEDGTETDAGTVQYEFRLEFKDGRYRYTLSDFVLRQSSRIPVEKWLNDNDPQTKSYLKQIDEFAQEWIASLKEGMKPPVEKKDDKW
jgi:hypothetical protein